MMNRRDFCIGTMVGIGSMSGIAGAAVVARRSAAVDSHAHVFLHDLTFAKGSRYTPTYDAAPETYLAQLDAHGIGGGLLVQPSFLGTDNSYMVKALEAFPGRFRGIAVVEPVIGRADIEALRRKGVVGVRWNLMGRPSPDFTSPGWQAHLAELKHAD